MEDGDEKLDAAKSSIIVNVSLILIKLAVGIFTGSLGVIAEFVHSFFDLLASLFAYMGIKKATEPADRRHQYGHERFENISSLAQSLLITITSLFILYEAYGKLIGGGHVVNESFVGIAAMIMTLLIDVTFSAYMHHKSTKTGSPALEADAYHFTTDIFSTAAVIFGLGATAIGYPAADIFSAIFVSLIMLYLSINLGKRAVHVMLDHAPNDEMIERISLVISRHPDIRGYHSLRARMAGNRIFVDVSVHLQPRILLEEAHRISEDLEMKIIDQYPVVKEVVIHIEPESSHDAAVAIRRIFGS